MDEYHSLSGAIHENRDTAADPITAGVSGGGVHGVEVDLAPFGGWAKYAANFDPDKPISFTPKPPAAGGAPTITKFVTTKPNERELPLTLLTRPDLLSKGGLDAKATTARTKSFIDATVKAWEQMKKGSKPTKANAIAAVKMLCQEEALHWRDDTHFIAAALERAEVMDADDLLTLELTAESTGTAYNTFTLKQKLKSYLKSVRDHDGQPSSNRNQYPDLRVTISGCKSGRSEPEQKLPAACEMLDKLTDKLRIYSFGKDHLSLAQGYKLLGLQSFCEWCIGQQAIMLKLINRLKATYKTVCHACNRDPETPQISESGTKVSLAEN